MRTKRVTRYRLPSAAVLYTRVSTEEQTAEGVSLGAQEAALRAYATARGLDVVDLVSDPAVSAGKPLADRPGGAKLVRMVERGQVAAVVATKLDRLFRRSSDCLVVTERWDRLGVSLHLLDMGGQSLDTSSTLGRFFLSVIAAAAEMERGLIRDRTVAALAHKRNRGEFTGGEPPYGFKLSADGKHLEREPAEQETILTAEVLRSTGRSLRAIARELEVRGMRSRTGRPFAAEQVRRLISASLRGLEQAA